MEIIARKSYQYLIQAVTLLIIGAIDLVYGILFFIFKPEGLGQAEIIALIVIGAAVLIACVPLFILNSKHPKIIACYDGGVFRFYDFECRAENILDADYKQKLNKSGSLTVYTKDGAHTYKNVKDVEFAYDKLAILILKKEGYFND